MPVSSPIGKDRIKKWFDKHQEVQTIIDVGAGAGTYRNLIGKRDKWIALEVWEPYLNKFNLNALYDEVIIGSISNTPLPKADCIIFGDIIEHLSKEVATIVLEMAIKNYPHVVISIPIGEYKQDALEGNPHEEHKSTWSFSELEQMTKWNIKKLYLYCDTCPKDMGIAIFVK